MLTAVCGRARGSPSAPRCAQLHCSPRQPVHSCSTAVLLSATGCTPQRAVRDAVSAGSMASHTPGPVQPPRSHCISPSATALKRRTPLFIPSLLPLEEPRHVYPNLMPASPGLGKHFEAAHQSKKGQSGIQTGWTPRTSDRSHVWSQWPLAHTSLLQPKRTPLPIQQQHPVLPTRVHRSREHSSGRGKKKTTLPRLLLLPFHLTVA